MKFVSWALAITATLTILSCQDEINSPKQVVTDDVETAAAAAGFHDIRKREDKYVLEGDILMSKEEIISLAKSTVTNGKVNHYSSSLVTGLPRVLTVCLSWDSQASCDYAYPILQQAVARFNNLGLKVTFNLLPGYFNPDADVNFTLIDLTMEPGETGPHFEPVMCSWPSGGNPGHRQLVNTGIVNQTTNRADAVSIYAHALGHAIGLQHTDYLNNPSCTGAHDVQDLYVSPGDYTTYTYVPNTPTGTSTNSWMLACPSGTDRPFTSTDIEALERLYGYPKLDYGREWKNGTTNYSSYTFNVADVTGDGKDDIIAMLGSDERAVVWVNNGTGFNAGTQWINGTFIYNNYSYKTADVTGDGKADLIGFSVAEERAIVWVSTGTSFASGAQWIDGPFVYNGYTMLTADVTGDGKTDLIANSAAAERTIVWASTGTSFATGAQWIDGPSNYTGYDFQVADVNNDLKADLVGYNASLQRAVVWKSAGSSFNSGAQWVDGPSNNSGYKFGLADMTGDNAADIITYSTSTEHIIAMTSTTTSFSSPAQWMKGPFSYSGYTPFTGKFNTDAKSDLVIIDPADERFIVYLTN